MDGYRSSINNTLSAHGVMIEKAHYKQQPERRQELLLDKQCITHDPMMKARILISFLWFCLIEVNRSISPSYETPCTGIDGQNMLFAPENLLPSGNPLPVTLGDIVHTSAQSA